MIESLMGPWEWWQYAAVDFDHLVRIISVLLLALAAVGVHIRKQRQGVERGRRLPPGPKPWPIVGSLGILGQLVHQDFARLSKKYGSVMLLRLGSINTVVISSPNAAKELLTKHDKVVAARPQLSQFQIITYDNQSLTMSSYGPFWRMLRKVFVLELMTARRLHQFQGFRKDAVRYMLENLVKDCKEGNVLQMRARFSNTTSDNVTRMAINKQYFGRNASTADLRQRSFYVDTFAELVKLAGSFVPGDYIPLLKYFDILGYKKKMRAIRTRCSEVFSAVVAEHRLHLDSSEEAKDFVDVLLNPGITEDNKPLKDSQIEGVLQDFIVAGTETSSTTAEWALAELLKNPSALRRAQDELDEVVGRGRLVEESDIARLPYLHAVVKENFRLHPAVPLLLPRRSTEPCEVEGNYIPSNSLIFVNAWAIGRDPDVWSHASDFCPERFMNSSMDTAGQHFELLPFGSGRRVCPGRALALLMVQYMLAALLHTFDWHLPPGSSPETLSMDEGAGTTTPRADPLHAVASPRLPPAVLSCLYQK